MRFAFTPEQEEIKRGARRFLEECSSSARVRALMATPEGYDRDTWRRLAGELGWTALAIPEAHGGLGLGAVELCAVFEEVGRALYGGPLFSTVCLGARAILESGDEAAQAEFLPGIAAGETLATLATEPAGMARRAAGADGQGHWIVDGKFTLVPDGHIADVIVVAAPAEGHVALFALRATEAGVERRLRPTIDRTRRLADLTMRGVRATLLGDPTRGGPALARTLDHARATLCAEQVGGAERCLELSVEYAKTRVQFGRPIGSFQAIKHRLADMLVSVESARSAAYFAAWAAACAPSELPLAAAAAKATCSEAYFQAASETIQVHGGIGFTWEHDAHLHFKRARAGEGFLGDPAFHREVVAKAIGL